MRGLANVILKKEGLYNLGGFMRGFTNVVLKKEYMKSDFSFGYGCAGHRMLS